MRARRFTLAALASCCALAAPAPGAQAGEVAFHFGDTLRFLPNPGEVNTVTVARSGANYLVTDTTTPPTAGLNCSSAGPNTVSCPAADVENISFSFGDLDDTGTVAASVTGLDNFNVFLDGQQGDDTLNAGPNVNFGQYAGGDDDDTLNGSTNEDRLIGNDGNDTARGGDGDDFFDGDDGNDDIAGQEGNDRIDGGQQPNGADILSGGPGEFDDLDYRRDTGVHFDANGLADDGDSCPGPGCEGDNVSGDFERIDTGDANDVVRPGGGPNVVFAGDGDDVVDGQGGNDTVLAGQGADVVFGGPGDDELRGGGGSDQHLGNSGDDTLSDTFGLEADGFSGGRGLDLLDFGDVDAELRIDLDNQPDDGRSGEGDNVRSDVEDVTGGNAPDVIVGSNKPNELSGGDGADRLIGKRGADGLLGEGGPDLLIGGRGSDLLEGGAAPDLLRARDGRRDEVRCGSARDVALVDRPDRRGADCDRVRVRGGRP